MLTSESIRYLATSSTATAFALSVVSQRSITWAQGATDKRLYVAGDTNLVLVPVGRWRGVSFRLFGAGADDDTFDYKCFSVLLGSNARLPGDPKRGADLLDYLLDPERRVSTLESTTIKDVETRLLVSGTATLSTATGIASALVTNSERFADGITMTVSDYLTDANTAYGLGSATVNTGTGNAPGDVFIPHLPPCHAIMFDFDRTGTTSACNALLTFTQ